MTGTAVRADDGTQGVATSAHHLPRNQSVNNLSLANLHTYYVLAGELPVLVHNRPE